MSGFIAGGLVPSASVPGSHINNDPFWPSIDLDSMREKLRIDSSVTPARLETAVVAGIISVNRDLAKWRSAQQAQGFAALADVPTDAYLTSAERQHLYVRAVECAAGAEVSERYRGYDSTSSGNKMPKIPHRPSTSIAAISVGPCATSWVNRAPPWSCCDGRAEANPAKRHRRRPLLAPLRPHGRRRRGRARRQPRQPTRGQSSRPVCWSPFPNSKRRRLSNRW